MIRSIGKSVLRTVFTAVLVTTGAVIIAAVIPGAVIPGAMTAWADTTADLRKLEESRFAMLVAKDLDGLEKILSPSLVYTHSNGAVETRQAFLDNIKSGKMVYRSIQPGADRMVTVDGPVGVITGTGDFAVTVGGKELEAKLRFTDVYVKGVDGGWRQIAWQSLIVEPPAEAAAAAPSPPPTPAATPASPKKKE